VLLFEAAIASWDVSPKLSAAAQRALERRRVEVRLDTRVTAIDARGVTVQANGTRNGSTHGPWVGPPACGRPSLAATLGARAIRAVASRCSRSLDPRASEVFVIGDLAKMVIGRRHAGPRRRAGRAVRAASTSRS